jgi:hypothetical protein
MKTMKNFIDSIGIEVECGINREEYQRLVKLARSNCRISFGCDGSVYVQGYDNSNIEVRYWGSLQEVKKFVKYLWEEGKIGQNSTCGNHVHLRLIDNALLAGIFSYKSFWRDFKKQYKKTFKTEKYLQRLNNRYCVGRYNRQNIIHQLQGRWNARYRAINLVSLREHNTIEIRLMPYAENMREHLQQVKWVYHTINKILSKFVKKNIYSEQIQVDSAELVQNVEVQHDSILEKLNVNKEVLICA